MTAVFENRVTCGLRWRDLDELGHLNHSVYHELLEEGRRGFMIDRAPISSPTGHNTYVVVRVELDYRHEIRKDHGSVDVVVRTGPVGRSSFTLEHDIVLPDGTLAATGKTVMVGWDAQTRGKRELTAAERSALGA